MFIIGIYAPYKAVTAGLSLGFCVLHTKLQENNGVTVKEETPSCWQAGIYNDNGGQVFLCKTLQISISINRVTLSSDPELRIWALCGSTLSGVKMQRAGLTDGR